MFIEELAFGVVTLNERRQEIRKGKVRDSMQQRIKLEILYWGFRGLVTICATFLIIMQK